MVDFAYDPRTGEPTISFRSDGGFPTFARFIGSVWEIQPVGDKAIWGPTSLAYDADGNPAISYRVPLYTTGRGRNKVTLGGLTLARFNDITQQWDTEEVDPGLPAAWSSLAFDPAGNPAIAYITGSPGSTGSLKFAPFNGVWETGIGVWDTEIVDTENTDNIGTRVSLAYDPASGNPAIVYTIGGEGGSSPTFARWNGSTWEFQTVDTGVSAGAASLAYKSSDIPFISYRSWESRLMNVAHWDGKGWVIETVETGNPICRESSLAFDPATGNPSVTYVDDDNILKFARKLPAP